MISFLWCCFYNYFLKADAEERFLNLLSGMTCFERVLRGCLVMLLDYFRGLFTLMDLSPLSKRSGMVFLYEDPA